MKIFVATPAYGGNVHVAYMQSVLNLQILLARKNIGMQFFTVPFDSLIPRARNFCVAEFLKSDCSHLLFIDGDIMFNPINVILMLEEKKPLLCGIYAKKALNYEQLQKHASESKDLKELTEMCGKYNINVSENREIRGGLIEVKYAPTGFMMIRKNELDAYISLHPEIKYNNDISAYTHGSVCYDVFRCGVVGDRYLSEDYYFCHSWKESGFTIHADLRVNLGHVGQFTYYSNPKKYFDV